MTTFHRMQNSGKGSEKHKERVPHSWCKHQLQTLPYLWAVKDSGTQRFQKHQITSWLPQTPAFRKQNQIISSVWFRMKGTKWSHRPTRRWEMRARARSRTLVPHPTSNTQSLLLVSFPKMRGGHEIQTKNFSRWHSWACSWITNNSIQSDRSTRTNFMRRLASRRFLSTNSLLSFRMKYRST